MRAPDLAKYITESLYDAISLNKRSSGIDLTEFLGTYMETCTDHRYLDEPKRDRLRSAIIYKIPTLETYFFRKFQRRAFLTSFSSPGLAITMISDDKELDFLESCSKRLKHSPNKMFLDENHFLIERFQKSLG